MPKINVLPDFVASQIAAGEVVERPSSVVKELVENSIDAGATQIEIAIASNCRDIRVADDGCGMPADDAALAFHRHATSKLTSADDLFRLRTLGFRGEALPSIASVSRVTCLTRTSDSPGGTKVIAEEGQISTMGTGCAPGTVIEITDLFYNVPARLKFLKKPGTEFAHIHETVQSLAIAHPKIVFQLIHDGEVVLKTTGSGKLAEAMVEIGLLSGKEELLTVTGVDMRYGLAVYGYAARAPYCRGDRKGIFCIVNNRPVKCLLTYKALDYAYSDLIPKGKSPIAVITITLDPKQVDANVHPTKKEIKYENSSDIYLNLQKALTYATRQAPVARAAETETTTEAEPVSMVAEAPAASASTYARSPRETLQLPLPAPSSTTAETSIVDRRDGAQGGRTMQRIQQLGLRDRFSYAAPSRITGTHQIPRLQLQKAQAAFPPDWRMVGYIYNTYILFETPDGLKVIEQHPAHERVLYERQLARQQTPGRTTDAVQHLVISAPLELSPSQKGALADNLDQIRSLGFEFDFQPNRISCTCVPLELAQRDYAGTVQQIIEQLLACDRTHFSLEATKSIACQAAIKNGMSLSEAEMTELIAEWYSCERNDTCPHGRPVCLTFSRDKLFQLFH
jgi:DNA mismatch repair protein MutL